MADGGRWGRLRAADGGRWGGWKAATDEVAVQVLLSPMKEEAKRWAAGHFWGPLLEE